MIRRSLSAALAAIAVLMVVGCANQPVAIVNGSRITKKAFYDRLEQAGGERVLADLIARQLLTDAFNKSGLKVTEQEIAAEIANAKKQAPSEADWQAYLKQQGMTEADFHDFIAFNLKVKRMAEKDVKVTEEALRKDFEANREQFSRPETVRLSEIVVNDKARADQIRSQLKDAAQFPNLARQYSISTFTRERGGMRPEEPLAQIQPGVVRQAVMGLQVGQITQPIKADNVWYIVKLEQRKAAEKAEYDKVKDKVREHYLFTHAKGVQDMIEELRKTARVRILLPKYQEMNRMFGPPQALPTFGETKGGQPVAPAAGQQPAAPAGGQQPAAPAAPATQAPAAPAAGQQPAAPAPAKTQ